MDRIEEARAKVVEEGAFFIDRWNQPKAHPATKAEKEAAKAAAKAAKAAAKAKKEVKSEPKEDIPAEFAGAAAPDMAMKMAAVEETKDADVVVEDSEEEATECEEFVHEGVTYWKAGNTLYDPETQEEVGTWNPKTGVIEAPVESEDELSEEELSDEE